MPPVGNDIVDLAAPGNPGKSGDVRFLGRVFTGGEQAMIAAAAQPDALLWAFWAVKEAAYKALSRIDPSVCSIPRQYRVTPDPADPDAGLAGKVITPAGELAFRVALTPDWVHALAAGSEAVLNRLSCRVNLLAEGSDPSAFVREGLLREIAQWLGCAACDLSVGKDPAGSGAPGVRFRDRSLAVEASLSHDGRYAAFAFDPAALVLPTPAGSALRSTPGPGRSL